MIIAKTVQRTRSYSRTAVSGSGASALFVSDGDSFAPRRELLLSAVTKVAKSTGRNCVSALPQRAILSCDFLRILAGIAFCRRCRIKGLCLRSPARRLTRPLASATAEIFRSYRHPLQAFPLRGPRGDRCPHIPAALAATYPLRCFAPQWARFDNRHSTSAPAPILSLHQRQRRKWYKRSLNRQRPPPHQFREYTPPNLHDPQRAKGSLDRRSKWFSLVTFFLQKKKVTRAGARNAPACARRRNACSLPPALSLT